MRVPPPGILRPNRAAIEAGLSFAQAFQNGPAMPWLARGGLSDTTMAFQTSADVRVLQGGHAMTSGYWGANSASNTYALDTTSGTMLAALVADHNPVDGAAHMIAHFGNPAFPAGPAVEMVKFNDSNFYFGIISTSNKRIAVSAVGQYAVGDVFTVATTWDAAGQVAYCKGAAIGSNASTGLGNTAGSDFSIGDLIGSSWRWATSALGGVLYVLAFDRALTPDEIRATENDMWWWCRPTPPRPARRTATVATPVTVTPGAGTLAWQGYAPGVTTGATASPGAGAVAWQGHAPAVTAGATASPGAAALAWQGQAPTVTTGATASPGAAALAWQGHAPTINPSDIAAPASRTITWAAQDRRAIWAEESRAVVWPATDRTVTWRGN